MDSSIVFETSFNKFMRRDKSISRDLVGDICRYVGNNMNNMSKLDFFISGLDAFSDGDRLRLPKYEVSNCVRPHMAGKRNAIPTVFSGDGSDMVGTKLADILR